MPPKTVLVLAAVVLAVIAAVGPASPAHAATDRFTIAYGDTISDGVPGVGAGNLEAGGDTDAGGGGGIAPTQAAALGHLLVEYRRP